MEADNNSAERTFYLRRPLPRSLYIHLPFCIRRCPYCDFFSTVGQENFFPQYQKALLSEVRLVGCEVDFLRGRDPEYNGVETVYFGGGTPSLWSSEHIEQLLESIGTFVGIADGCEITLEANPSSLSFRHLSDLRAAGINRLSIGVQATDDNLLRKIGRLHNRAEAEAALKGVEKAGFVNISIDLITGLPTQTVADIKSTISWLRQFPIRHVSAYSLIIEPGTTFADLYSPGGSLYKELPDPADEREQWYTLREGLKALGFEHYEISNFARPGYRSRHNSAYWSGDMYWGLGAGAHAYYRSRSDTYPQRRANPNDLFLYAEQVERADQISAMGELTEVMGATDIEKEFFLLGLRILDGVDLRNFTERFGREVPANLRLILEKLAGMRLLVEEGSVYRLSLKGEDYANRVFGEFI